MSPAAAAEPVEPAAAAVEPAVQETVAALIDAVVEAADDGSDSSSASSEHGELPEHGAQQLLFLHFSKKAAARYESLYPPLASYKAS